MQTLFYQSLATTGTVKNMTKLDTKPQLLKSCYNIIISPITLSLPPVVVQNVSQLFWVAKLQEMWTCKTVLLDWSGGQSNVCRTKSQEPFTLQDIWAMVKGKLHLYQRFKPDVAMRKFLTTVQSSYSCEHLKSDFLRKPDYPMIILTMYFRQTFDQFPRRIPNPWITVVAKDRAVTTSENSLDSDIFILI